MQKRLLADYFCKSLYYFNLSCQFFTNTITRLLSASYSPMPPPASLPKTERNSRLSAHGLPPPYQACHHGTDNLRERDCRRVFIINLESAVNQIATRIAVQALFCNIKFNERLLLHSVGNSLARSLTNYPLSFQIRQLGNGFFLLQHDYGTIGSTA